MFQLQCLVDSTKVINKHSGGDPGRNWGRLAALSQNSNLYFKKGPFHNYNI